MLNERIRALRLAKGLTLQQVGDVFGISRASVSNWEAGHAQPDPRKIERLAELFNTSVQYLIAGHEVQTDTPSNTFAGLPFIAFGELTGSKQSLRLICQQSEKFFPAQTCLPSREAFCTNFPHFDDAPATKLIPAGALVFVDPAMTAQNQSITLGVGPTEKSIFFLLKSLENSFD